MARCHASAAAGVAGFSGSRGRGPEAARAACRGACTPPAQAGAGDRGYTGRMERHRTPVAFPAVARIPELNRKLGALIDKARADRSLVPSP